MFEALRCCIKEETLNVCVGEAVEVFGLVKDVIGDLSNDVLSLGCIENRDESGD